MSAGDVQLKLFEIELPGRQTLTNALYANGRHQCRVNLLIVKEVEDENGNWRSTPLTPTEVESATITGYGVPAQPLPSGWYCDRQKNKYDAGLRRSGVEGEEGREPPGTIIPVPGITPIEQIARYMRVNSDIPIEIQRFMGYIVVGGKVYTTNGTFGTVSFNSYVHIEPTRPYRLNAADLTGYQDTDAYTGQIGNNKIDVDVYYWTPPAGLNFVENRGLDRPVQVNNEGLYFQTSFIWDSGSGIRRKGGIIWKKDTLGLQLRIDDVQRPAGHNPYIEFNRRPTIMRAIRYIGWVDTPNSELKSAWRLWDNYGCEHVFYVDWASDRNLLELKS